MTSQAVHEKHGKSNIVAGLLFMAGFMVFGFVLIYLRDFAPGKERGLLTTPSESTLSRDSLTSAGVCSRS